VNIAAHNKTNTNLNFTNTIAWLIAYYLSHCYSNTGKEAKFVLLDLSWSLLQKSIFQIGQGKSNVERTYGRWYSKYGVLEVMATLFPFLEEAMEAVV